MKICCISDMHGKFPQIEECDLVLICGDSIDLKAQNNPNATMHWYLHKFKPWANNLPCDKVLFIAGNHDLWLDRGDIWLKRNFNKRSKVTYLENELFEYKGLRIFGTPYCKMFGNWAFMYADEILRNLFAKIPENLDILMSHDAPYGCSDLILEEDCYWATKDHIGSKPLREAILEKKPKLVMHGHLHSSNHLEERLGDSIVRNCSVLNEKYELYYLPIYIEI